MNETVKKVGAGSVIVTLAAELLALETQPHVPHAKKPFAFYADSDWCVMATSSPWPSK